MTVGTMIRSLRRRQHRKLSDIASPCGLTVSMISKIENNRASPSVSALTNIASALGVSVATLLEEQADKSRVFNPAGESASRQVIAAEKGYRFFPFATERVRKSMQPFLFVARRGEIIREPLSHAGEEFIYMLSGEMRYFVGTEEFRLRSGDGLYYDAEEAHDLEPVSKVVEYLAIFGPSGEEILAEEQTPARKIVANCGQPGEKP